MVTFAVVTATILGIGTAQSGDPAGDPYDGTSRSTSAPGPLTTPTVAPDSGAYPLRNPTPPPKGAVPVIAGEWILPPWPWDELPELAEGADEQWRTLQSPGLSELEPPIITGCEDPTTVDDRTSYEEAVREQWSCVHEAWLPILTELGLPVEEPAIQFFPGSAGSSRCGKVEAPAFYCPMGEGTAHFGGDVMEAATYWDLMIHDTVHHEYAHHIQNLIGIMDAADNVLYTTDIDRRLELQATCWAGAMTIHDEVVDFDQRRWEEWRDNLDNSIPDDEHGTLESLRYWGTRGLYAETLGDCNTWTVVPERVS